MVKQLVIVLDSVGNLKIGRTLRLCSALVLAIVLTSVGLLPAPAQDNPPPAPPEVNAQNVVVLSDFNEILYARNPHERVPMASLTKLMTAIVAVQYGDLDGPVTITDDMLVGEATMGLVAGDQVTVGDLLYGLLMPSGNDAAMAVAYGVGAQLGGTDPHSSYELFISKMNETARHFQLLNTHFENPHGLDQEGHYSCAYDVAIMMRAALNYPEIRERMQTLARRVGGKFDLYNGNQLLRDRDDILGGKTGLTDNCGYCLAAAAKQGERMVIAVVLQDDWSWFWDVSLLLDYGFQLAEFYGPPEWAPETLIGTQLSQSGSAPTRLMTTNTP